MTTIREDKDTRIGTLVGLLRDNGNKLDDTVRALFTDKFGKKPGGPTVAAAYRILGIATKFNTKKETPVAVPSEMTEALNMMQAVEKLLQKQRGIEVQIESLERELAEVKLEIDVYKPAIGHLKALASAVAGVRSRIQGGK